MFIYLIYKPKSDVYKIGVSKNPDFRIKQLQTGSEEVLELITKVKTNYGYKLEKYLHRYYKSVKQEGEWFKLTDSDILLFEDLCSNQERNLKVLTENNLYINSLKDW